MEYFVNPAAFSSAFTVPTGVVDQAIKLARGEHVKVLLYMLRHVSKELTYEEIAEETDVPLYDVKEAMLYWADAGLLCQKETPVFSKKSPQKVAKRQEKPSRTDIARRGAEDQKIRYLLNETQMKLGRNLKSNETATLVWLYDDAGLDVSVLLMIVQYAVAHEKANIRFIESTAVDWINRGITTLSLADEELRKMAMEEGAWKTVRSAFGLDRRKPGKKEAQFAARWVCEWEFSKEMLCAAYDACVDAKSSLSFPYIDGILKRWHEQGIQSPKDIEKQPQKEKPHDYAAYDLDLFEQMLKSKY